MLVHHVTRRAKDPFLTRLQVPFHPFTSPRVSNKAYLDFVTGARSPPPGPASISRGSSYRSDPPSRDPGPRSGAAPGAPVRQPTGPGLNSSGFDRSRRDMDVSYQVSMSYRKLIV
jgi:hypothetical protein